MSEQIKFQKYPSIENSYRQKHIIQWLRHFPDLYNEAFLLQEKMHGANIQFEITPSGQCRVFSRKNQIGKMYIKRFPNDSVMLFVDNNYIHFQGADILEVVTQRFDGLTLHFFKTLLDFAENTNSVIRAYGELCGPRVQKGVHYCDKPTVFFFDISQDGQFLAPIAFYRIMSIFRPITVRNFEIIQGVYEAIDYDITELYHGLSPDNIIEGVVIKPCYSTYQTDTSIFYLKKKNEKFKEKQKSPKETKPIDEKLVRLNQEFGNYITHERIKSVFSKTEPISEPKQIGEYIKLVTEDALEDFTKDFEDEFNQLNKQERKHVTNVGSTVALKLKEYL